MAEKDLYLKIGKPQNVCSSCQQPINTAGKHPSILRTGDPVRKSPPSEAAAQPTESPKDTISEPPADGPRREDYCADCWQQITERDYLGYWMARRDPPKPRKIESRKERNAGVLAWFDLLRTQEQDDDNLQAQYFLAHLLMKYGVFKWQRTETDNDGAETIYFRQAGTDDDVAVVAVELSDEKSVEIKRQLDEFLLQFANREQPEENARSAAPDADD